MFVIGDTFTNRIKLRTVNEFGNKFTAVQEAASGTVCAVTGVTFTRAGDGLGAEKEAVLPMLEPVLTILDETDSGLDVDALRIVAEGFNRLRTENTSAICITHYQRMLDYIKPDIVHVMLAGRIVRTGGPDLAYRIEEEGFDWLK